jgi:hypothetical protein
MFETHIDTLPCQVTATGRTAAEPLLRWPAAGTPFEAAGEVGDGVGGGAGPAAFGSTCYVITCALVVAVQPGMLGHMASAVDHGQHDGDLAHTHFESCTHSKQCTGCSR